MNKSTVLHSPAKLNLFLHILGRQTNGYHKLQTAFQLIDLYDVMHFTTKSSQNKIKVTTQGTPFAETDNIVYQAALKLKQHTKQNQLGVNIHLEKKIPIGGGLGGGSSNAATTLLALNSLWELKLTHTELMRIGLSLGADVPLFIYGHNAWAEGVGESLAILSLPSAWYVIVDSKQSVATAEIFQHPELQRDTAPSSKESFLTQLKQQNSNFKNDCQATTTALYPKINAAINWLKKFGKPQLTGTGGCIFARFNQFYQAKNVIDQMPPAWDGILARGINLSPICYQLGVSS